MEMDLPSAIRAVGVKVAAKELGETERTVKSWLYGERTPRPEKARKIARRWKDRVSMASIYGARQ